MRARAFQFLLLTISVFLLSACAGRRTAPHPSSAGAANPVAYEAALEGAVWGMPIVSVDAMRMAFFRDAGAKYGDVVYLSRPADWKFQITTPNAAALYVYFNFNLKNGPVVLDIPAAVGAGLFGSLLDAWQVPVVDVGPAGEDAGKGGKYLLIPPNYRGAIPRGYLQVNFQTFNGYAAFRAIPQGSTDTAAKKALQLVKRLRVYPWSKSAAPSRTNFIDMAGKEFDGIVRFDDSYYEALARMLNEEAVPPRDADVVAKLKAIGIVPGEAFTPDANMRQLLAEAARQVQLDFIRASADDGEVYWSGKNWRVPHPAALEAGSTYVTDGKLDAKSRGLFYFLACAPPKNLGKATFYLSTFVDSENNALSGDKSYRLHVPANVPAEQFWAATVYARSTAAFIRQAVRVEANSYNKSLIKNADGSVDIFFGPTPPSGQTNNWVATVPGGKWFTIFRFYGPQQSLIEKSWLLPDIEEVK